MKQIKVNYILGALIIVFSFGTVKAQQVAKIGYFMDHSTHKHLMNPALVPLRGYVSIPALGSVDFDLRSNLSLPQFLYPGSNGQLMTFLHEDVTPQQFLSQLNPDNYLRLSQRLSILSAGAYFGSSFWTFEVASRVNAGLSIPYDFFAFLKKGMDNSQGNRYEIRDLKVGADALVETSLGSSFIVAENIRVGVKGKVLIGAAKAVGGIDEMIIDMKPDKWIVSSNGSINLYGAGLGFTKNADGVVEGVEFASPGMSGMGFALDLGASWKPLDFLEVSAGLTDLGRITWKKNHNRVARAQGSVTFTGIENISLDDDGSDEDPFKEISDQFMELAQFKESTTTDKLSESLSPTLNIGAEAGVLDNKVSFGLLYTGRMIPGNTLNELTGVLNLRPIEHINLATSYTLIDGVQQSFGLALGINLVVANLFIACDYIPTRMATGAPIPLSEATTHIQIGASVSLGKNKVK
jgi:hypothetical protein